jgi:hypothetical protein
MLPTRLISLMAMDDAYNDVVYALDKALADRVIDVETYLRVSTEQTR